MVDTGEVNMEVWPTTLPIPEPTFDSELEAGLADTEEILNPIRTRTYPERSSKFHMVVSAAQFFLLRTFYKTTLCDGQELFTADWLIDIGFSFHRLRFIKAYRTTLLEGLSWDVNMDLEIIAGVPFDGSDVIYWICPP